MIHHPPKHPGRRRRLGLRTSLALLAVFALSIPTPGFAAEPQDQPSVGQYTDPFGPTGTGSRPKTWNPFVETPAPSTPAPVRRRLEQTADGATLAALIDQVDTERARIVRKRETGSDGSDAPRTVAGGEERTALASAGRALFTGGSQGGWLLGGLLLILAAGVAATLTRSRLR